MSGEFKIYLLKKAGLKAKYVPFYQRWVESCYLFLKRDVNTPLDTREKEIFLKHLSKSHEDWQVKQADTALRHYAYFLSLRNKGKQPDFSEEPVYDKELENRLRRSLRLKQRSYRTEKTYVKWTRSFLAFLDGKSIEALNGKDIQEFLSYLAVERRVASATQDQAINALVFLY